MDNIKLDVSADYVLDLHDDFMMNTSLDLYQFIDYDPVRAFHLGVNIGKWFENISQEKQYLYSKQLRHNKDSLEKYVNQYKFWVNKLPEEEIDYIELCEYLLNNMFWKDELDQIKVAFSLGQKIKSKDEDK